MASRVWTVLGAVIVFSMVAFSLRGYAEPDGYYMGEIIYRSAGVFAEYKTADAACKGSVESLEKNGNHQQFIKSKKGTSDDTYTCVLKDLNSQKKENWDQLNNVTMVMKCKDGSNAVSHDNSGKWSTVRCRCDKDSGNCTTRTKVPPPVQYNCMTPPDHPMCIAKKAPPGVENSDRCKQQPASPMSKKAAARHSEAMQKQLTSTGDGKEIKKLYDAAFKEAQADLEVDKAKAFPKFTKKDMCDTGGPTDINIGMPCGTREADFAAANNIAGLGSTPTYDGKDGRLSLDGLDCVWHHHEELGRMQLIKKSSHNAQPHTGGVSIWTKAMLPKLPKSSKEVEYPLCCPPKK